MSEYQDGFKDGVEAVAKWMVRKAHALDSETPHTALAFLLGASVVRGMDPPKSRRPPDAEDPTDAD